jgi:hypothetical protein
LRVSEKYGALKRRYAMRAFFSLSVLQDILAADITAVLNKTAYL